MLPNTLRFTTLLGYSLLVSTLATIEQDFSSLPQCSVQCLTTSLGSSGSPCAPTDFACLCKNKKFLAASDSCNKSSCSGKDAKAAKTWGEKACQGVGVKIAA
ncbi:hypothetical protein, variant [Puccinia triticina 1-1 BBBD Race 1]|nr:uncharacterized protein PtA15_7A138 [Puccinia triticina]OAV88435.1 hypothetical protein, variant [Puccinia triticina 1-1 BBBD Race 1]WAQ86412.1 hypothetical protein PtA15_7A138 [Puccinia triticina]